MNESPAQFFDGIKIACVTDSTNSAWKELFDRHQVTPSPHYYGTVNATNLTNALRDAGQEYDVLILDMPALTAHKEIARIQEIIKQSGATVVIVDSPEQEYDTELETADIKRIDCGAPGSYEGTLRILLGQIIDAGLLKGNKEQAAKDWITASVISPNTPARVIA
jgi:hypothetical protein